MSYYEFDRAKCTMYHAISGTIYCDYYDFGCFKCVDIKDCPEEKEYEEYMGDEEEI